MNKINVNELFADYPNDGNESYVERVKAVADFKGYPIELKID